MTNGKGNPHTLDRLPNMSSIVGWPFVIRVSSFLFRQMRIRLQPFPHELVEFLPRRLMLDALDDLAGEGVNQHPPRRLQAEAARAEIKNGFLVQLPDRRAVRAFHVV